MKNSSKNKVYSNRKIAILILLLVAIAIVSYFSIKYLLPPSTTIIPELSTDGYSEVVIGINVTEDMGIVSLSSDCYDLSVAVERSQAVSIENGINGVLGPRPATHDLIKDMLKSLGANVLMVKINDFRNGTYYSKIVLRKENLILSLDSRPSDALAIAARTEYLVPIYVKDSVLRTGTKIC